MTIQSRD